MAVAATITSQINLGSRLMVEGILTFSGNYVAGGEIPTYPGLKTSKSTPTSGFITNSAGYVCQLVVASGKVDVLFSDNNNASDGPLIQIPVAAYPAGLTGGVTQFTFFFNKP